MQKNQIKFHAYASDNHELVKSDSRDLNISPNSHQFPHNKHKYYDCNKTKKPSVALQALWKLKVTTHNLRKFHEYFSSKITFNWISSTFIINIYEKFALALAQVISFAGNYFVFRLKINLNIYQLSEFNYRLSFIPLVF